MPLPQNLLDLLDTADESRAALAEQQSILDGDEQALAGAVATRDQQALSVTDARTKAVADAQAALDALREYFGPGLQASAATQRRR